MHVGDGTSKAQRLQCTHSKDYRGSKELHKEIKSPKHGGHEDCKGYDSSHHCLSQVVRDVV